MENKETQLQVANDEIQILRQQLSQALSITKVELQNKNELLEERSHALAMERSFPQHLKAQAAKTDRQNSSCRELAGARLG